LRIAKELPLPCTEPEPVLEDCSHRSFEKTSIINFERKPVFKLIFIEERYSDEAIGLAILSQHSICCIGIWTFQEHACGCHDYMIARDQSIRPVGGFKSTRRSVEPRFRGLE